MSDRSGTLRDALMHDNVAPSAHVVVISVEFLVHHAASLKDKRRVAKSIKDRLRARFNASVAEIGNLDDWRDCTLGIALIGNERAHIERDVNAIQRFMEEVRDIELVDIAWEWL